MRWNNLSYEAKQHDSFPNLQANMPLCLQCWIAQIPLFVCKYFRTNINYSPNLAPTYIVKIAACCKFLRNKLFSINL